jgi:serine/threonine-protein kinase
MGIVFLARDVVLERQVAIKMLSPELGAGDDMRRRFLREARIAAQCFHPNIVPIHAVEEYDGLAWIVMAYVRGETLAERVQRLGPMPAEEVRRLAREVAWALAYAHQRGVVHRDIKPENILIEATSGRYLIADFGIARQADDDVTASGAAGRAGTPRYMAPEQAVGESVDGRADLYALGATLYFAATGRPPFIASSAVALLVQHSAALPTPVRSLAPLLPVTLADAIDRCLAKQPEDRHQSAEAFVETLSPTLGDASMPTPLMPLAQDARSARSILGWAAAAGVTTLLLGVGESNAFGRAVVYAIGGSLSAAVAFAGVLRSVETLIRARRLLRAGHDRDDVAQALASEPSAARSGVASRAKYLLAGVAGGALAIAQGRLGSLEAIPEVLRAAWQATLMFAPVALIARGVSGMMTGTRFSRVLHDGIGLPVARGVTRLVGSGIPETRRLAAPSDNAATEMLLDRAIHDALAQLPTSVRETVGDAGELASSLAREADALRREDVQLSNRERAARLAPDGDTRDTELATIASARALVRGRLVATIAALEGVRLDILRLEAGHELAQGLTSKLEAARELGRRIDAQAEVNALLRD